MIGAHLIDNYWEKMVKFLIFVNAVNILIKNYGG